MSITLIKKPIDGSSPFIDCGGHPLTELIRVLPGFARIMKFQEVRLHPVQADRLQQILTAADENVLDTVIPLQYTRDETIADKDAQVAGLMGLDGNGNLARIAEVRGLPAIPAPEPTPSEARLIILAGSSSLSAVLVAALTKTALQERADFTSPAAVSIQIGKVLPITSKPKQTPILPVDKSSNGPTS